jgi:heat shock transcription factor
MSNQFGDQYLDWNQGDGSVNSLDAQYADQSVYDNNLYNTDLNGNIGMDSTQSLGSAIPPNSTQLVRRNPNQQLATRNRTTWPDSGSGLQPSPTSWDQLDDEDERDLEQRALVAKREAQAKRKQIPPFVQKLSRYVTKFLIAFILANSHKASSMSQRILN